MNEPLWAWPIALSIAGSDSGGGAGIQADLKTFAAHGVHGLTAVTAITAQSTREVRAVHTVPPSIVESQIKVLFDDFRIRAVKTGMLSEAPVVDVVARSLLDRGLPVVVDPVMVSETGTSLLSEAGVRRVRDSLIPLSTLLTPNLPEVGALLGTTPKSPAEMIEAAEALRSMGASAVLIKGGHLSGDIRTDVLLLPDGSVHRLSGPRISTTATHGTGCTYAAAIAAGWARGDTLLAAVQAAHQYLRKAMAFAPDDGSIGGGAGPVHHFHAWWGRS